MKRVLIADDEPHMLRVLKLHLERAGYGVTAVSNGSQALESILASPPDVLITDIQMPVMTGQQLCLALQEQLPARTFPVFVMTSMTDREHREWTQDMENLEFLEKPLSMRSIIQTLQRHFEKAPHPGGAGSD
jgi:CheY-like chemotaxis protein